MGNSFSYIDNLTMVRGAHTLKFGVEVRRVQLDQGNSANGAVLYSSLNLPAGGLLVNSVSSATYNDSLPLNGLRKTEVYSYAQDEWKLRPNLVLNFGLRYVFFNIFHEVHGKAVPFDFATCGAAGYCGPEASFGNPNTLDVDPRISVAWSPTALAGGKTVIRSGFGIYHGDGQLDDQNVPIKNEVGVYSLSAKSTPGLSYPITPFLNGPGTRVGQCRLPRPKGYVRHPVGLFRAAGASARSARHTFICGQQRHFPADHFVCKPHRSRHRAAPISSLRPGQVARQFQRKFVPGLHRQSSAQLYPWTAVLRQLRIHTPDRPGFTRRRRFRQSQNPACMACERASGDFDVRHVVNADVVYDLPFGPKKPFLSQPGIARAIFGRWSVTDIICGAVRYSAQRRLLPFQFFRRHRLYNQSASKSDSRSFIVPPGGKSIRGTTINWINPAAFTAVPDSGYGDTPRNIARGPNLWQADLGLSKRIQLTERAQLQFRCEAFNIFNRAQYSLPLEEIWLPPTETSPATIEPQVSTASTTPIGTGTPREIQFALRLEF